MENQDRNAKNHGGNAEIRVGMRAIRARIRGT